MVSVYTGNPKTNFALQLKGWRENMENFCGSKPPEGGCGSRQAQGFYPLWQPTASVFHGNRRFADCDPIAQFDRFDPRTTIGLPLELRPKEMPSAKNTFPSGSRTWNHSVRNCALYQLSHDASMSELCDGFESYLPYPAASSQGEQGKYNSNPSHCTVIVASWLTEKERYGVSKT
ncbi:Apolipoprotein N-acyltransferase [Frankliniella fusca]|uniref:Apolipoprotein N-acyltransferase n=1 Tax=Frankliniella fusca TaxID=407009 RepID=A0AAE1LK29_9NEOP|nr:Apolipoprotein N-acyltransferase [Frankliniella fusca]